MYEPGYISLANERTGKVASSVSRHTNNRLCFDILRNPNSGIAGQHYATCKYERILLVSSV